MLTVKEITTEVTERIDPRTTGSRWAKIRNIAGVIAGVSGGLLLIPILPIAVIPYIQALTAVSVAISGRAWIDKSNIKK